MIIKTYFRLFAYANIANSTDSERGVITSRQIINIIQY